MKLGLSPARAATLCLAASLALMIAVRVFDALGYVPCPMCLRQRDIHWLAVGVAVVTLVLSMRQPWALFARIGAGALALVYLGSVAYAIWHAGVEYHWWPSPPCEVGAAFTSGADLLESLSNPSRAVPCDQAAWRLFGISLAGYNALASLVLAGVAAAGALSPPRGKFFR